MLLLFFLNIFYNSYYIIIDYLYRIVISVCENYAA